MCLFGLLSASVQCCGWKGRDAPGCAVRGGPTVVAPRILRWPFGSAGRTELTALFEQIKGKAEAELARLTALEVEATAMVSSTVYALQLARKESGAAGAALTLLVATEAAAAAKAARASLEQEEAKSRRRIDALKAEAVCARGAASVWFHSFLWVRVACTFSC
jgi:hypothetical protein